MSCFSKLLANPHGDSNNTRIVANILKNTLTGKVDAEDLLISNIKVSKDPVGLYGYSFNGDMYAQYFVFIL